jgi:hypothetical protein
MMVVMVMMMVMSYQVLPMYTNGHSLFNFEDLFVVDVDVVAPKNIVAHADCDVILKIFQNFLKILIQGKFSCL